MSAAVRSTDLPPAREEEARLREVLDLELGEDGGTSESLEQICLLACRLFHVPVALVTLLGRERQRFIAKCGTSATGTARKDAFCNWAVTGDEVFVVTNAAEDPRFRDNPLVNGGMRVRFYAGAPLTVRPGLSVGALCLKDTEPRQFAADDAALLKMLAAIAVNELQRRRALLDLQRQQELLFHTEALSRIGSWVLDVKSGRLIWSPQMYRLLEVEIDTTPTLELMLELSIIPCWDLIQKGMRRPKGNRAVFESDAQIPTASKDPRFVRCIARCEIVDGRIARVTGSVQDITEQKKVERIKSEFISTVSHELRTPLTSIMGSLGLLRTGALGPLPEKSEHMINLAHGNGTRLVNLINDLLDIEKIESGQLEFRREPQSLRRLIERAAEQNAAYAARHGARIRLDALPRDASVETDARRFQQAMDNLISNAAKFSPAGGEIRIGAKLIGGTVRISVADQGPGIPHKFRNHIFEKFAQADSSDAREKGGTGLGLSIAKAIIERLGGRIGFETEIGAGTTFYFDLPAERSVARRGRRARVAP